MKKSERELLKRYLSFMAGFEESMLYQDYKMAEEDCTDSDYQDAIDLISSLSEAVK